MKTIINFKKPHGSGNRSGYGKVLSGINTNKKGGYAFEGEFLNEGENDLRMGSLVVIVSPKGSAKNGWKCAQLFRVEAGGFSAPIANVAGKTDFDLWEEFSSLRNFVEEELRIKNTKVVYDRFPAEEFDCNSTFSPAALQAFLHDEEDALDAFPETIDPNRKPEAWAEREYQRGRTEAVREIARWIEKGSL